MGSYRLISSHGEDLDDGRVIDPGEFVELDDEQVRRPRTQQLLAEGRLVGIDEDSNHQASLAGRRFAGHADETKVAATRKEATK